MADLLEPLAGRHAEKVAALLLDRFGSIDRIFSAEDRQIIVACEPHLEAGNRIVAARTLVLTALQARVCRRPVCADDPGLAQYLTVKFRGRPHEELYAIFLDHAEHFISEELVAIGNANSVDVQIRQVLKRAIELGAAGFLLVHNHPAELAYPSIADVRATKQLADAAHMLGLALVDHLIVAGSSTVSLRNLELL